MFLSVLFLLSLSQWEIELINKFKHKILKNYKINAQVSIHSLPDVSFLVCMKICLEHIFNYFFFALSCNSIQCSACKHSNGDVTLLVKRPQNSGVVCNKIRISLSTYQIINFMLIRLTYM